MTNRKRHNRHFNKLFVCHNMESWEPMLLITRLAQCFLVLLIGTFAASVTWNNLVDPNSNLTFVQHLMSMDTTFEHSTLRSRAVTSPAMQRVFFYLIVLVEGVAALLCVAGSLWLFQHLTTPVEVFHAAKWLAMLGLITGFALWFGGFMIIGGQWFASWQSKQWNGRESAFMFYSAIGIVIVVLLYRV
jgi:predicted small integral membrane protein